MSTPKGYPNQHKDDRLSAQFATVEPIREQQYGLSVLSHATVEAIGTDAVEANSTTSVINATGHSALKGDVIRFTSGALSGKEVKVSEVDTNTITLAETLPSAPATLVAFQILRHRYPVVDSSGNLLVAGSFVPGPIQYVLDGADTDVTEDTVTPANNRPLPVKIIGAAGEVQITAGSLEVALDHSNDSVKIGDGTDLLEITASGEALVKVNSSLPAGTNNIGDVDVLSQPARSHTTDSIRIGDGTDLLSITGSGEALVSLTTSLPSGTNNIGDVDVLSQPVRSHTTDSIRLGDGTTLTSVTLSNELKVADATAQGSLSSIATNTSNTATNTSNINGKLNSLGQKTMANSMPVTIASDQTAVPASQSGTWNITNISGTVSLPTGAATESTLSTLNGKFNTLGQKTMANSAPVVISSDQTAIPTTPAHLDVIDLVDGTTGTTALYDASVTNVPASGGSPQTLVASLAATVKAIQIFDTTGGFIGVYTGAAASEVLKFVFGPGSDQTVDVSIASGTRISIRNLQNSAISTGMIAMNFLG